MASEKELFADYVKHIHNIMNSDVDPCEDFFNYACGNYAGESDYVPPYNHIFATKAILDNQDITWSSLVKARDFYISAKKYSSFKKFLDHCDLNESIGGWPALNANWAGESFNPLITAANLSAVGLSPIFKQHVKYDRNTIKVSISARKSKELTNLHDDLQKLGVSEELIADVVRDVELISRKIETVPHQQFERRNCYRVETIQPFSSLKDEQDLVYKKYFETYFGHSLNNGDICCIANGEYLSNYYKVFVQSDPKSVANYIFWRAGRKFLGQKFPVKLTLQHFTPAVVAAGFSTYFTKDDERKSQYVLSTFLKSFLKIQHKFTPDAESQSKTYISDVNDTLKYKNSHYQQETVDKEYDALKIDPENFFKNIINIKNFPSTKSSITSFSDDFHEENALCSLWNFLCEAIHNHNKPILHHMIRTALSKWRDVIYSFNIDIKDSKKYPDAIIDNQIKNFNLPEPYNAAEISKAYALALKEIIVDYEIWLKDNEELENTQDEILHKFNLDNNKILFVAFAQRFCYKDFQERSELMLALLNSSNFSATFNCKLGSRMNPKGNYSI